MEDASLRLDEWEASRRGVWVLRPEFTCSLLPGLCDLPGSPTGTMGSGSHPGAISGGAMAGSAPLRHFQGGWTVSPSGGPGHRQPGEPKAPRRATGIVRYRSPMAEPAVNHNQAYVRTRARTSAAFGPSPCNDVSDASTRRAATAHRSVAGPQMVVAAGSSGKKSHASPPWETSRNATGPIMVRPAEPKA